MTMVDALTRLGEPFLGDLQSLYANQPQTGLDGKSYPIDASTRISVEEGLFLYDSCRNAAMTATLEVGMGYGFSTTFLLAALDANGGGRHIAIDPYQHSDWDGIGESRVASLLPRTQNLKHHDFTLIHDRSDHAAIDLERSGASFDLLFIDGYHRFDDVLIDVYLLARLCRPNGLIVLHDLWLPSVQAVQSFLCHNRPDLQPIPTSCPNLAIFRRRDTDQRNWDHFVPFPMTFEIDLASES